MTQAQDRGYKGAADVAGFGNEVPNPGGFNEFQSKIWGIAESWELAELEAVRGNFVAADDKLAEGDDALLNLTWGGNKGPGGWKGDFERWRNAAGSFVNSLRQQEAQLVEAARTHDAEVVHQAEVTSSEDAPRAAKEVENLNKLYAARDKGATSAELTSLDTFGTLKLAPLTDPKSAVFAIFAPLPSVVAQPIADGFQKVQDAVGKPAAIGLAVLAAVALLVAGAKLGRLL